MTTAVISNSIYDFQIYGNIHGCIAGNFQYSCHFCPDIFIDIIEFQTHVLLHFTKEREALIPIEPKTELECDDLLVPEIDPDPCVKVEPIAVDEGDNSGYWPDEADVKCQLDDSDTVRHSGENNLSSNCNISFCTTVRYRSISQR